MQIKIGENLRKLRIKNELTQEKLAEVFGVSPQAISRWENNSTYPDVTMLPGIANYYNVSIDELMGMDEIRNIEKINSTFSIVHEYESKGMINEAIQTLREAIKLYPNNYGLLSELALALTLKTNTDIEYDLFNEAIALSERVLLNSTNEKIRSTTKTNLCFLYLKVNEDEKAIKLAKTLPHIWECREIVLPEMFMGDDYFIELKKGILTVISIICEKIENSKKHKHSSIDKIIAIGSNKNSDDELKGKIELITQFLDVVS
ncbi:helix-turn-helix domain-containing protein [Clostridium oryzae]|uniref:HTH-type transcriptional regulator ImmR n=1 Tax=Clostridium oryzae TaxID=1450648 RepID=A0A1V4IME8_9CLOT|nr:helix-turn-helix transcriptional regulator [Clostridium oryzae]OPJ61202.1 HTH-type transcriptional regulator ImmR [Clostridium oryzae]